MLTISQLATYAGVTVRAVRHYHQIGLLPEPERDASGYRRYGAKAVVSLIKIRTLASAGVPLSQIALLLEADASTFAEAVQRIDSHLREEIERLETSRKQIAELAAGDGLGLAPEVTVYLDRLREIGVSERMVEGQRDGWILIAARWPDRIAEWIPGKIAELDDPQAVRLYRLLSEIFECEPDDNSTSWTHLPSRPTHGRSGCWT
jgi:DNA-binding transcriptional MerR regulator